MLDLRALIVKHLRSKGLNFYTRLPPGVTLPAGRIQKIGVVGPSSQMPDHLYQFDLQVDIWAEDDITTQAIFESVSDELRTHPSNEYGQITRFEVVSADDQEDETWPNQHGQPSSRILSVLRVWGR